MLNRFKPIKELGEGHFGKVFLAYDTILDYELAIKILRIDPLKSPNRCFQEAKALKTLQHNNIVKIIDAYYVDDQDRDHIYIAMEPLHKGCFEKFSKTNGADLSRVKTVMSDVLRGLQYAHDNNIFHGDIKPSNIMIGNNNEAKLADFGQCMLRDDDSTQNSLYCISKPPECITSDPLKPLNISTYDERSDIYMCGLTMYRLVNGDGFLNDNYNIPPQDILKGKFPNRKNYKTHVPEKLRRLINKAMHIDPTKRYQSAIEMRRALEKIDIHINWRKRIDLQETWIGNHNSDNKLYEVTLQKSKKGFAVNVKSGKSKSTMRLISSMCHRDLSEKNAQKMLRKTLDELCLIK